MNIKANRPLVLIASATILIFILGIVWLSGKNEKFDTILSAPTNHEYYWSDQCTECKKIAEFLDKWNKKDKIQVDQYDANKSDLHRKRFFDRGNLCKIPRNQLGIPLLITPNGICYNGVDVILDYFKDLEKTS